MPKFHQMAVNMRDSCKIPAISRMIRGFWLMTLVVVSLTMTACSSGFLHHGAPAPEDPVFDAALELIRKGRSEEAEAKLAALVAARPLHVPAHRAWQQLRLDRYEHINLLRDYRKIVADAPDSAEAHYLLGRLLHPLEDQESQFALAARLSPDSAWGHYGLAWIATVTGRIDLAFQRLNHALAAQPGHKRSRHLLVRLLLSQTRYSEANGVLNRLLQQDPYSSSSWLLKARLAGRSGKTADEEVALERVIELEPTNREARSLLLSLARAERGGALGFLAADTALRTIPEVPRSADDFLYLAQIKEIEGSFIAQEQAVAKSLKLGTPSSRILDLFGTPPQVWFTAWTKIYQVQDMPLAEPIESLKETLEFPSNNGGQDDLRLCRAFLHAGFLDETHRLLESQLVENKEKRTLAHELRAHRRVLARMQILVDGIKDDATLDHAESLRVFLGRVAAVIEEETGYACDQKEAILGLPLVGSALDASKAMAGTVNGYLRQYNQIMFAGRLAGASTQALVFTMISGPRRIFPDNSPGDQGCFEVIGGMVAVRSQDESFGDSAGRALFGTYFIDLDILMPWKKRLSSLVAQPTEVKRNISQTLGLSAHGSSERMSLAYPAAAAEALVLKAYEQHGDLLLLDSVRIHEQGHLFDSFNYLPMWRQVLPNLLLVLRGGFSSLGIMAELEEAAALHALRYAKSPHLVLAELVRALPKGKASGPHAQGYKNLLSRFLIRLDARLEDFPTISPDRMLLHQLHLLSEEEVRSLAFES